MSDRDFVEMVRSGRYGEKYEYGEEYGEEYESKNNTPPQVFTVLPPG